MNITTLNFLRGLGMKKSGLLHNWFFIIRLVSGHNKKDIFGVLKNKQSGISEQLFNWSYIKYLSLHSVEFPVQIQCPSTQLHLRKKIQQLKLWEKAYKSNKNSIRKGNCQRQPNTSSHVKVDGKEYLLYLIL